MKIYFRLPYYTRWGENILVTGNIPELGNNNLDKALPLNFKDHELWTGEIEINIPAGSEIYYNYLLLDRESGVRTIEWGNQRKIKLSKGIEHFFCYDNWNAVGDINNTFATAPFQQVLLKNNTKPIAIKNSSKKDHIFRIKAPLLDKNIVPCIVGGCKELGDWSLNKPLMMNREDEEWVLKIALPQGLSGINYKYGAFDTTNNAFLYFENGHNRYIKTTNHNKAVHQINDGFFRTENPNWRGAGVSLPVFSIRTRKSFGVGDFNDLKLLIDWAEKVGIKMIQVLPLNDSNGTHTELDVLPYAAISAFALNPLFLNLPLMGELPANNFVGQQYVPKQAELNAHSLVSFTEVINYKMSYAKELFKILKEDFLKNKEFKNFFNKNAYWLVPYAAFITLTNKYKTNDFTQWGEFANYDKEKIELFASSNQPHFDEIALHYFIQYHLHKQLSEATVYAHEHNVVLKGDIPIGVNRFSADTWSNPALFNNDMVAGAPPDMFAIKGQNWSLPTYNWEMMKKTDYDWWKKRFNHLSNYFDAFRIDHILGFFRIWEIPTSEVEGIMGHLYPSIPIYINEFAEKGIWFDYNRFCKPYINDQILHDFFGDDASWVRANCINIEDGWILRLKPEYQHQENIEKLHLEGKISDKIKWGLFDLISNVLFFEVEGSNRTQFYPRYGMHFLRTYADLDNHTKKGLDELYIHYYYKRQNDFWYHSGMEKLPELKRATNMLVCGEDLGMMNPAVTAVMNKLGILSLEIQRAPKSNKIEFFHPNNAPYLSVVTPSTHDMSTIRGWWEEDRAVTQRFYNNQLGHWGDAPIFCEWWIVRDIILQHLHSPAMWSVFQMQDLLGISPTLRRENPHDERINVPSDSLKSWRYRLHINMEDLLKNDEFNTELKNFILQSGR